ncbi:MAG: imidazolonepropionase [Acidobacteria bacterium]|nr:imidazolonepropionase [Acidobacteriota bacterium]
MIDRPIAQLVIRRADTLFTCAGPAPRRGTAQGVAGELRHAAIAARDGRIVFVGPDDALNASVAVSDDARVIDAAGSTVVPGFVDPHTHAIYAGDRRDELLQRLSGATYADLASRGGGILATVRATRAASEEELLRDAAARLDEMLRAGTTTAEVKSGYGLDLDTELKLLRVVRKLAASHAIDIVTTFLGAHEVPPEHRATRERFIESVVAEMIPAVAAEALAEWCDVFCEAGVFTPEEARLILDAGIRAGLKARIHADEFAPSGGALVAAAVGARSADHLLYVSADAIRALATGHVVATLLPIAAFYLKLGRFAPARALINAGVPVALGTDMNPGGGFSPSMPFAITLGCFAMAMTFEESLVAATLNAAYALDRHDRVGSLEVGKQMDAVILGGHAVELLRVGADAIRSVIKRGRVVASKN